MTSDDSKMSGSDFHEVNVNVSTKSMVFIEDKDGQMVPKICQVFTLALFAIHFPMKCWYMDLLHEKLCYRVGEGRCSPAYFRRHRTAPNRSYCF